MHLCVFLYLLNSLWITDSTAYPSAQIYLASLGPTEPVWAAGMNKYPHHRTAPADLVQRCLCWVPWINYAHISFPNCAGDTLLLAPDEVNKIPKLCPSTSGLVTTLSWLELSVSRSALNGLLSIISSTSNFLEASLLREGLGSSLRITLKTVLSDTDWLGRRPLVRVTGHPNSFLPSSLPFFFYKFNVRSQIKILSSSCTVTSDPCEAHCWYACLY